MYINCKGLEMGQDKTGRKEGVYNEGHKVIVALKEPRKVMGCAEKARTIKSFGNLHWSMGCS
jgi:hypothetical protein